MNKQLIHHSASGTNTYIVECYYRHSERVWRFNLKSPIGDEDLVSMVCPHPSQEYLNIYYDGDLMRWREEKVNLIYVELLTQRALQECDYCATNKAKRVSYKLSKNAVIKRSTTPKVVTSLFAKHLLEKGDYACLYMVTASWNCDAYYTKSK